MKYLIYPVMLLTFTVYSFAGNKITYLDPVPGAKYINTQNGIIIGFEKPVNLTENELKSSIVVTGSASLSHEGKIIITGDRKKILFNPETPFQPGEKVTVGFKGYLTPAVTSMSKDFSFSFYTWSRKPSEIPLHAFSNEDRAMQYSRNSVVPTPYPSLTVTVDNNPSEGYMFLAPFSGISYLLINDNHGNLFWNNPIPFGGDFKKQPNGNLTYWDGVALKHFQMDPNYNIIDSFYCGNGYVTDIHELRVLNSGFAYVMAYDTEIVNMSLIIPGGDTAAAVVGFIVQEIDLQKNVVFQWRSWDHFAITDAWHENLLAHDIDAVHGNAIEVDVDSNIIISSRHLDEITKISRTNGDIMWRFGGKNNQFTFLGDTLKFTYQHAVRRLANGNLTIYDNGNWHTPPFSRAVEYSLDEINKTATTVWQFNHNKQVFGSWGGYVQRLPGGNTLISWGGTTSPTITEVDSSGTIVFEGSYPAGIFTYRGYKFDWNGPITSTGSEGSSAPFTYRLNQNYPNPFNPSTKISFAVPRRGAVRIVLYDILGNEVRTILNEVREPGNYSVQVDASALATGVYFYRMESGSFTETRKMILLK